MNIMNKVTLRILQKNKTRTIVTIIGVILSTAMFTAVTTFISSLQNYVVSYMMVEEGDWHGVIHDVTAKDIDRLAEIEEVENLVFTRNGGYSYLEHTQNEYKPYLHILELEDKAFEHLPIQMI
ncbi:MAG TPA: ABC transporter permease, partial [Clostridiales bacterium]|nr:ABC transporter permease [Clostridiales bacterium]